jgi:hypothetical protein
MPDWNPGPAQGALWGAPVQGSLQDGSGGQYEYVSLDAHEVGCDTVANLLFSAGYEVMSNPALLCPIQSLHMATVQPGG